MRIVPSPDRRPHSCAITGKSEDPGGFLDTGVELPWAEPRIYISAHGASLIAEQFDYVSKDIAAQAIEQLMREGEEKSAEIEQLHQRITELEGAVKAVDVLVSEGFRARSKPGRKAGVPQKREEVSA